MVLSRPKAAIAEQVDVAAEFDGVVHGIGRGDTLADRRLVEDAEFHGGRLAQALLPCEDLASRGARDDP